MTAFQIKAELHKMIDNETDERILHEIKSILQKANLDQVLKDKLTSRALKSEKAIKEGRVLTIDQVKTRTEK